MRECQQVCLTWLLKDAIPTPALGFSLEQLLLPSAACLHCYDISGQMTLQPSCLAQMQYASMEDAV